MKNLFLLSMLAYATSALAADQVLLEVPVTYHPKANVVEAVRRDCRIEDMLSREVGGALGKLNKGLGTVASAEEAGDARVLRLKISYVFGIGGGSWTGPKSLTVHAELLKNGKVLRETRANRGSMGGVFGAFKGTCSILDRCAAALGKDLSQWASDDSYQLKEGPAPKEAEVETAPADVQVAPAKAE